MVARKILLSLVPYAEYVSQDDVVFRNTMEAHEEHALLDADSH